MLKLLRQTCVCSLVVSAWFHAGRARAQDGAGYNPAAAQYRAPALSLAGGKDSAEVDAAPGILWSGQTGAGLAQLEKLADEGDAKAQLFLGSMYRGKNKISAEPHPAKALHFFEMASRQGSGEASERIAEMLEQGEVPAADGQTAAGMRSLAVQQGWVQQALSVFCMIWIHGPARLHCDIPGVPADPASLLANGCPSDADMAHLRNQGLTGTLRHSAGAAQPGNGPVAQAILIMDKAVVTEQDLKQPYASSVVYLQKPEGAWQMLPTNASLLDRYIVLTPSAGGTGMIAQNPDGSGFGSDCGPPAWAAR